jgi:hypothetical protein
VAAEGEPDAEAASLAVDHLDRLVDELIEIVDHAVDDLTSRPDDSLLARQLAAGCVLRCRALLLAMRLLEDEHADVNGVLIRNLWEAVIVGLDLLTDEHALRRLGGDMQANQRKLIDANSELADLRQMIEARGVDEDRFIVEQAAERVANALGGSRDAGYSLVYRGESTFGGHGLGLASPYVDLTTTPWRVAKRANPINVADARHQVAIGALFASLLVAYVFEAFGLDPTPAEAIHDTLAEALATSTG